MKYPIAFATALMMLSASPALRAADAPVEVQYTNEKPLMVIRFNQRNVMYERSLYNTVAAALAAKPSVMFDLVSVGPQVPDSALQGKYDKATAANTARVLATLQEMGVPQSRMTLTSAREAVPASEVRIFAR